ncbi:hypothetical protein QE320_gp033 [Pseudomonas phage EM]|uniref:Uncharacterized protein n=1 Tax=Pseudomonas phage EM TaxID=2936914 RepID=A0AAE9HGE0_9CAUD|nr:hypothetical protein QE320_gp033 [Pseudomonas phage EM]UPW35835.1 hypothetical protein EM_033 [Pseudomonas phage EM]
MVNMVVERTLGNKKPQANTLVELIDDGGSAFIVLMTSNVKSDGTFEGVALSTAQVSDQFEMDQFRVMSGQVVLSN